MNATYQSLADRWIDAGRTPRPGFVLAVAGVLTLTLVVAALADGQLGTGAPQAVWRLAMAPSIIVFILGIRPVLQRRWQLAIDVLISLAGQRESANQPFVLGRFGKWVALLLGAGFGIWIGVSTTVAGRWLSVYVLATHLAMFGMMAQSIHEGLCRTIHLKRVVETGLKLDLFDRQLLMPVARWGQSISLTFVGGECVSLLFQSHESLYSIQSLMGYSIVTTAALTLFFTSLWSVHVALAAAQTRELAIVRKHWSQARQAMLQSLAAPGKTAAASDTVELYEPLVMFAAYERQVLEASTWPFNPKIIKQLLASVAAPVLIYAIRVAAGLPGTA